jgi:hypothetical protein
MTSSATLIAAADAQRVLELDAREELAELVGGARRGHPEGGRRPLLGRVGLVGRCGFKPPLEAVPVQLVDAVENC